MIRLRRGEPPEVLEQPYADGLTETERALAHYGDGWDGSSFSYARYKELDVRRALDALCPGKCAYCESRIHAVSHEDVEHFRPKGSYVDAEGEEVRPGYYWLGAEWTNLLPSCPHCNRRSRKDLEDPDGSVSGKQSLFPVADEERRWRDPEGENREQPLLLDPCTDEPAELLAADGPVVAERHPEGGLANRRARASIEIFGLNRAALVQERREQLRRVDLLLRLLQLELDALERAATEAAADGGEADPAADPGAALDVLAQLAEERGPAAEYLFFKRPRIDAAMARLGPRIERLGLLDPPAGDPAPRAAGPAVGDAMRSEASMP